MMTIFYFIVAISLLVVIHEFGHFWVARRCGVKVLRFSVGFGKPLVSVTDRHGTEFAIAPIPLGGYVKMLDEREAPVADDLLDQAFNRKSVGQRIAIAAAGPIANFIFAILAYWALLMGGTTGVIPVIGDVKTDSIAAQAGLQQGDEWLAIEGEPTPTWQSVNWQFINFIGETTQVQAQVLGSDGTQRNVSIAIADWLANTDKPDPMASLGVVPRRLQAPAIIGEILADGAAQRAGLIPGDRILEVNGTLISDWSDWVDQVRAAPNRELLMTVDRDGQVQLVTMTPEAVTLESGEVIGRVGAGIERPQIPADWLRVNQLGVLQAFNSGLDKTIDLITFTLTSLWKMLAGDVSVKNLSGPITIAKVAGDSASTGLETFVGFLALLSVSLGVLNLLPIPMLDGGHIVFYAAEWIRGKPISERVQMLAVQAGMFLLMGLMLVAFYNDISRL